MTKEEFQKEYQELRGQEREINAKLSKVYKKKEEIRIQYFKENNDWFDKKYIKIVWPEGGEIELFEVTGYEISDTTATLKTKYYNLDCASSDGVVYAKVDNDYEVRFSIRVDDKGVPSIKVRTGWPWNDNKVDPVLTFPTEEEWVVLKEEFFEKIKNV